MQIIFTEYNSLVEAPGQIRRMKIQSNNSSKTSLTKLPPSRNQQPNTTRMINTISKHISNQYEEDPAQTTLKPTTSRWLGQ